MLDIGLDPVGHFPKPHGTGEAGTALEGMQSPQHFLACAMVVGTRRPLPQGAAQLRHQLGTLFLNNRKQIRVDHVNRIDLVIHVFTES